MAATDLAVLGAGPAGLWAARRARAQGMSVVLLEQAPTVGGIAGSFTVDGVRVDHGSHRLHRATGEEALSQLRDLLGDDLQVRTRKGRIRLADRWIPFPLTPASLVRSLPPGFAARALSDVLIPRRQSTDSFAAVVRERLGPTMLDRFYGPYARKIWGREPEGLSGEQARRRIGTGSVIDLAKRVLRGRDPEERRFYYPRRGFGQLWDAVSEAAVQDGVDLRLSTPVTGIATDDETATVWTPSGPIRAGSVLSTIPAALLPRLWRGATPVPGTVSQAADALQTRAMVLVYISIDGAPYTEYDAHYLPESWTPFTRISEPTNYRDNPEDPREHTVLCAELPCQVDDYYWRMDNDALGREVVETLWKMGLPRPSLRSVHVRRVPHAYPILDRGAPLRLQRLEGWVAAQPRLLTLGRQGLFAHDNTHHALAMAEAAVLAASADGIDRQRWAQAREGFRDHVVED